MRRETSNIEETVRYICKYCYHCNCQEYTEGSAYCDNDIHYLVDVNNPSCSDFDYDDTFVRT
ncbi:hypothetical protein K413DRAFT_4647 [Clostridium sp. ASBs410]|nr:hypothetical protein K413DRAFT_4647 [Clostridium sp. ASBs410]